MPLKKIISGGQTGTGRAALDAVLEMDLPYGGWLPKGRLTEEGVLPAQYDLDEIDSPSYSAATEQNVIESDGTVIFSHAKLAGMARLALGLTIKYRKPCLHIDFEEVQPVASSLGIYHWIDEHQVETLHVIGPKASRDAQIYAKTFKAIRGLLVLALADSLPNYQRDRSLPNDKWPVTLDAAIGQLETALPLKMRVAIANMGPDEIVGLNATIGNYIRTHYGLGAGNHDLMRSCADTAGRARLDQEDVSALILDRLALRLKETHRLRVIK